MALRRGKDTKPNVAIEARVDLPKAASRLEALRRYGLAEQDSTKHWRVTRLGKTCCFETVPDERQRHEPTGPLGRRILGLLNRPMRGAEVMEKLRISTQLFRQTAIKLHAQGRLRFGDPKHPSWIVMRANDFTSLLSRTEERVLSAFHPGQVTSFTKLKSSTRRMPEDALVQALEILIEEEIVEAVGGMPENPEYRLAAADASHPQRIETVARSSRRASPATRPPLAAEKTPPAMSGQAVSPPRVLEL